MSRDVIKQFSLSLTVVWPSEFLHLSYEMTESDIPSTSKVNNSNVTSENNDGATFSEFYSEVRKSERYLNV